MFRQAGGSRERGAATSVGRWLAQSWVVRVVAIGLAIAILGVALYGNAMYRAAFDEQCNVLPAVDLSMQELIDLRKRVAAYQQDPSPDASLALSGREIAVLFGDGDEFQMRVDLLGDRARVDMALPNEAGCWNVHFAGRVHVDDGKATVTPEELQVGGANLGWLTRNATWTLHSDVMPDDRMQQTLENTHSLDVMDGVVRVRLSNRWDLW